MDDPFAEHFDEEEIVPNTWCVQRHPGESVHAATVNSLKWQTQRANEAMPESLRRTANFEQQWAGTPHVLPGLLYPHQLEAIGRIHDEVMFVLPADVMPDIGKTLTNFVEVERAAKFAEDYGGDNAIARIQERITPESAAAALRHFEEKFPAFKKWREVEAKLAGRFAGRDRYGISEHLGESDGDMGAVGGPYQFVVDSNMDQCEMAAALPRFLLRSFVDDGNRHFTRKQLEEVLRKKIVHQFNVTPMATKADANWQTEGRSVRELPEVFRDEFGIAHPERLVQTMVVDFGNVDRDIVKRLYDKYGREKDTYAESRRDIEVMIYGSGAGGSGGGEHFSEKLDGQHTWYDGKTTWHPDYVLTGCGPPMRYDDADAETQAQFYSKQLGIPYERDDMRGGQDECAAASPSPRERAAMIRDNVRSSAVLGINATTNLLGEVTKFAGWEVAVGVNNERAYTISKEIQETVNGINVLTNRLQTLREQFIGINCEANSGERRAA